MKRNYLLLSTTILLFAFVGNLIAQPSSPVSWKFELKDLGNGEVQLVANATISSGWQIYGVNLPSGGPVPTTLSIDKLEGATEAGNFEGISNNLKKKNDPVFKMEVSYYKGTATFGKKFKVTNKEKFVLQGDIRAQACNESGCMPPLPIDFSFTAADIPATKRNK